jgi:hypothetical protein
MRRSVLKVAQRVQALIVLDQVDLADTGVITASVLDALRDVAARQPSLFIASPGRATRCSPG